MFPNCHNAYQLRGADTVPQDEIETNSYPLGRGLKVNSHECSSARVVDGLSRNLVQATGRASLLYEKTLISKLR